jgi:hypothetical protein
VLAHQAMVEPTEVLGDLTQPLRIQNSLNPSLADSPAHTPQNPGFPQRQGGRFKSGQALSGGLIRVVP